MSAIVRPNPLPTLMRMLNEDENVIALIGADPGSGQPAIYAGKLPAAIVDKMPINCVLFTMAGGHQDYYLPMHWYRVQTVCYGGGAATGDSSVAAASLVAGAVANALANKGPIFDDLTTIKCIELTVGPEQIEDVDMNNTPAEVMFFRVCMPTIPLLQPA